MMDYSELHTAPEFGAREREKKEWNSSKHKLNNDKSVPCKHKERFSAVAQIVGSLPVSKRTKLFAYHAK